MPVSTVWLIAGIAIAMVIVAFTRLVGSWWKFRGARLITCPENQRPAGVQVDAAHAALTSIGKSPELRLSTCSRWPERSGCGQQCLTQIEAQPEACLIRHILAKWYEGKVCACCSLPFGEISWAGAKPAVIRADKVYIEWNDVSAEELSETLATGFPVCFACYMANKLVCEHPDLAVDRAARPISRGARC
jgi:hypothetical protein